VLLLLLLVALQVVCSRVHHHLLLHLGVARGSPHLDPRGPRTHHTTSAV